MAAGAISGITATLSVVNLYRYGSRSANKYQVNLEQQSLMIGSSILTFLIACGVLAKSALTYKVSQSSNVQATSGLLKKGYYLLAAVALCGVIKLSKDFKLENSIRQSRHATPN